MPAGGRSTMFSSYGVDRGTTYRLRGTVENNAICRATDPAPTGDLNAPARPPGGGARPSLTRRRPFVESETDIISVGYIAPNSRK